MREPRARLVYEVMRRHRRGDSQRSIARALSIDPKTVRRIIRDVNKRRQEGDDALIRGLPPRRAPRPSKLDPYTEVIADLLARYPNLRATRLHEELCARGFDGGYTIVREHLKKLRPRPAKKPRTLVQTPAGKQRQFDWSPYELVDGTPIRMFGCVLSYSRYRYARFCTDTRQPTIFRELRRSFEDAGGVAREYVVDTMPGVVDGWDGDEPLLNLRAVDFAVYYDFELHVAPRGDGAYKGKIERTFPARGRILLQRPHAAHPAAGQRRTRPLARASLQRPPARHNGPQAGRAARRGARAPAPAARAPLRRPRARPPHRRRLRLRPLRRQLLPVAPRPGRKARLRPRRRGPGRDRRRRRHRGRPTPACTA